MTIHGSEKCLGAKYEAKRIENDEVVYGLAAIEVDDEKSYLIQMFETDDFTDGVPARAHYIAVRTNTVALLEDEEDSCQNCGECKCISCAYREDVCFLDNAEDVVFVKMYHFMNVKDLNMWIIKELFKRNTYEGCSSWFKTLQFCKHPVTKIDGNNIKKRL